MAFDRRLYAIQLTSAESKVPCQSYRVKSELRRLIIPVDMDMGGLVWLVCVEVYPVGPRSKNGRHRSPQRTEMQTVSIRVARVRHLVLTLVGSR